MKKVNGVGMRAMTFGDTKGITKHTTQISESRAAGGPWQVGGLYLLINGLLYTIFDTMGQIRERN